MAAEADSGDARRRLSGTLRVELPPEEAFHFFTPRGERLWISHWDPWFPAMDGGLEPEAEVDDTEPGTVFRTGDTIWVVIAREPGRRMAYARITPEDRAGTVTVTLDGEDPGISVVTVEYDLTALTAAARDGLRGFAKDYPAMLLDWEQAIAAYLAPRRPQTQ